RNHTADLISIDTSEGEPPGSGLVSSQIRDCLLVDNVTADVVSAYPFETDGPAQNTQVIIDSCTIANNSMGPGYDTFVLYVNFAELTNSIVYARGPAVMYFPGYVGDLTAEYVLANNASTLAGGTGIVQGAPSFVDAANQDYHLARTSPAVDFAPAGLPALD